MYSFLRLKGGIKRKSLFGSAPVKIPKAELWTENKGKCSVTLLSAAQQGLAGLPFPLLMQQVEKIQEQDMVL